MISHNKTFQLPIGWLVFIIALLLRILHLVTLQSSPPHHLLFGDSFLFDYYAQSLANGTLAAKVGSAGIPVHPCYVVFLASLYKLFGYHPFLVRIVQIILGSLSCALLYQIGRKVWNKEVGFFAGMIAALSGISIFYDAEILKPCLTNFLLILSFYLLLFKKPITIAQTALTSLVFSLTLLLREQLLVLTVVFSFWLLITHFRENTKKAFGLSITFLLLTLFLPFFINTGFSLLIPRNSGLTETSGIHFYIGNHPSANGTYTAIPGITPFPKGHYFDAKAVAERSEQRSLTQKEVNRYWFRKGLDYIWENPTQWLRLELKKLFLIMNAYEIPNDDNYPNTYKQSWVLSLPLFSYGIICPLALLGIGLQLRRMRPYPNLLICFAGTYIVILLLTFVTATYRFPLQIFFTLFAGFALFALKEMALSKNWVKLVFSIAALIIFCWISNAPTYLVKEKYEQAIAKHLTFLKEAKEQAPERLLKILNS